jgi:hypothetical protein
MKTQPSTDPAMLFLKYLLSVAAMCFSFVSLANIYIWKTGSVEEWGRNHNYMEILFISFLQFIPTFIIFSLSFLVPSFLIYKLIYKNFNKKAALNVLIGFIYGIVGIHLFSWEVSLVNDMSPELYKADLYIIPVSGIIGGGVFSFLTSKFVHRA